jgi:hypothetical protein
MSNNKIDAERGKRPVILTDVFGTKAPKVAQFGVGATVGEAKFGRGTQPAPLVEEATRARRDAPLGHAYADRNK